MPDRLNVHSRVEKRFVVTSEQLGLAQAMLGTQFVREPYSGQFMATQYLATREFRIPVSSLIRIREYGLTLEEIDRAELGYLEIKADLEGKVSKGVSLLRIPRDGGLLRMLSGQELEDYFVSVGLDLNIVRFALGDIGFQKLLPLVETISQRLYFTSESGRVTLDLDEQVYGFFGEDRKKRIKIGEQAGGRLEIKILSDTEKGQLERPLIQAGISLLLAEGRKKQFQRLYLTKMEELSQKAEGAVFTNEVLGHEVERKLQITMPNPLEIINSLYILIGDGKVSGFSRMKGKDVIKEWEFRFINYGVWDGGKLMEAVVVVVDPDIERFGVKRKGGAETDGRDLVRSEVVTKYEGRFEGEIMRRILEDVQKEFSSPLVEVGNVMRRKRYTYATNRTTGRNYKIGVDECVAPGGQCMSQLEIEYMGRDGVHQASDGTIEEIESEIDVLEKFVFHKYGSIATPTKFTKFEWLVSLID